jgi:hypothetical protein
MKLNTKITSGERRGGEGERGSEGGDKEDVERR